MHAFLMSAEFFSKSSFRNTIQVSNSLDPDQVQHSVSPDLGPNCCKNYQQMTLADKGLLEECS